MPSVTAAKVTFFDAEDSAVSLSLLVFVTAALLCILSAALKLE